MPHSSAYLLQALTANDQSLSRTASAGKSDTSVSAQKSPLRLRGEDLVRAVNKNRETTAKFIEGFTAENLQRGEDVFAAILAIAGLTLSGLLPAGLYRSWELPVDRSYGPPEDSQSVPVTEIGHALRTLAHEIAELRSADPFAAAAVAEWGIGIGPLHPFYDACGRISRAVSALVLSTADLKVVSHARRDEYLEHGASGKAAFAAYLRTRPRV